jgi:LysM repeat protein
MDIRDKTNVPICGTCAAEGTETTYTVVNGDILTKIAGEHGVPLDALIAANRQIEDIDVIYPWDNISIPVCG